MPSFLIKCDITHLTAFIPDMWKPSEILPVFLRILFKHSNQMYIFSIVLCGKLYQHTPEHIVIRLFGAHDSDRLMLPERYPDRNVVHITGLLDDLSCKLFQLVIYHRKSVGVGMTLYLYAKLIFSDSKPKRKEIRILRHSLPQIPLQKFDSIHAISRHRIFRCDDSSLHVCYFCDPCLLRIDVCLIPLLPHFFIFFNLLFLFLAHFTVHRHIGDR